MTAPSNDEDRRVRSIRPPRLDPEDAYPSVDCQHETVAELFFGPTEENEHLFTRRQREEDARAVCAECPFLVACALHGLEHEDYGIWGGLTEQDRRSLGGRGRCWGGGRPPGVRETVLRMGRAGVRHDDIKALLRRWGRRRRGLAEGGEAA